MRIKVCRHIQMISKVQSNDGFGMQVCRCIRHISMMGMRARKARNLAHSNFKI